MERIEAAAHRQRHEGDHECCEPARTRPRVERPRHVVGDLAQCRTAVDPPPRRGDGTVGAIERAQGQRHTFFTLVR